jgi:hypothetical protein
VKWSEDLGEQGILQFITRSYIDHIRIILHMAISFIILLYIPVFLFCIIVYKAVRFVQGRSASG